MQVILAAILAGCVFAFGIHTAIVPAETTNPVKEAAAVASLPAPVVDSARPGIKTHVVAEGENLNIIAQKYGVDTDTLIGANPDKEVIIHPGDQLTILPQKGALHTVSQGDTLWDIGRMYRVAIDVIVAANPDKDTLLAVGDKLFIPGGRPQQQAPSRGQGMRFNWPVAGELSSPFGYRWGRLHAGLDIAADTGQPIVAACGGRVAYAGWYGGYGYAVVLEHDQGYSTLYGHMSDYVVDDGDHVAAGNLIGYVGSTGNSSGPHLHFEVRRGGEPTDPLRILP